MEYGELRTAKRYLAKERTYAMFSSEVARVGIVRDISRGGLSLEYVTMYGPDSNATDTRLGTVDVLLATENGHLSQVPCELIYTGQVERAPTPLAGRIPVRRCGLRFGKLTKTQRLRLDAFLARHVIREENLQPG